MPCDNVVKAELDSFDLRTADYYSRMDAVSNEALVGILKRRTNSKGEYLSSYSGSKVKLISNVKKLDRDSLIHCLPIQQALFTHL